MSINNNSMSSTSLSKSAHSDIIIVGGGAAGLFAALLLSTLSDSKKITLLEKQKECGSKLNLSGSSQCNITQKASIKEMIRHYGEHGEFLLDSFNLLSPSQTMTLFEKWGVALTTRSDGKVFPSTFKAHDVSSLLINKVLSSSVTIKREWGVEEIVKRDQLFYLKSKNHQTLSASTLLIATGGFTYPKTGSQGDGYRFARSLGHSLVTPKVALSSIDTPTQKLTQLAGVSVEATLTDSQHRVASGSLLFTHTGLSGPLILNHSRYLQEGQQISICYFPTFQNPKEIERKILEVCSKSGSSHLSTLLHSLGLPKRLVETLLLLSQVNGAKRGAEVGKKEIQPLCSLLSSHPFSLSLKGKAKTAMVSCGGVSLGEIDSKTMESTLVPNLYFAGEVIDIDGDTGGYNLQAAWSTAATAALAMSKRSCSNDQNFINLLV